MAIFYRVHPSDAPPLTADNAWSAPWGTTRSSDGSQYECIPCDGTGEGHTDCPACYGADFDCDRCDGTGYVNTCENCDGEGWLDCDRGYSAFETAEALDAYFNGERDGTADGETVLIFEGNQVGYGLDMEPLAVPTRIIETLPWAVFAARHQQGVHA